MTVVVSVLAAGIGSIHFLTPPHLFTFAFVLWTLARVRSITTTAGEAFLEHNRCGGSPRANLHGGFLAGPLIVATAGLGHAISGPWDAERRRRVMGFASVFAASCIAPLAQPLRASGSTDM